MAKMSGLASEVQQFEEDLGMKMAEVIGVVDQFHKFKKRMDTEFGPAWLYLAKNR